MWGIQQGQRLRRILNASSPPRWLDKLRLDDGKACMASENPVIGCFEKVWWDDSKMVWDQTPPTPEELIPKDVNFARIGAEVRCELGVPLKHKGICVGVAWLKYDRDRPPEGTRVFESWVTGDIRLVAYHLSKNSGAAGGTSATESAAVPSTDCMRMVVKASEVPDSFTKKSPIQDALLPPDSAI